MHTNTRVQRFRIKKVVEQWFYLTWDPSLSTEIIVYPPQKSSPRSLKKMLSLHVIFFLASSACKRCTNGDQKWPPDTSPKISNLARIFCFIGCDGVGLQNWLFLPNLLTDRTLFIKFLIMGPITHEITVF
jgi:hypothetical protein